MPVDVRPASRLAIRAQLAPTYRSEYGRQEMNTRGENDAGALSPEARTAESNESSSGRGTVVTGRRDGLNASPTKRATFEVGKCYRVPCMKAVRGHRWDRLFAGEYVPVIGPEHRDAEIINFPHLHWHIDWRFASDRLFKAASRAASIVGDDGPRQVYNRVLHRWPVWDKKETMEDPFTTGEVVLRLRKCRREFPEYPADLATWLPRLESSCAGMTMHNMTCPHRGTPLETCTPDGDIVTCPAHGLRWNVKTGELVKR